MFWFAVTVFMPLFSMPRPDESGHYQPGAIVGSRRPPRENFNLGRWRAFRRPGSRGATNGIPGPPAPLQAGYKIRSHQPVELKRTARSVGSPFGSRVEPAVVSYHSRCVLAGVTTGRASPLPAPLGGGQLGTWAQGWRAGHVIPPQRALRESCEIREQNGGKARPR